MAVADYNRDGRDDVAVTYPVSEGKGKVSLLLNQGGTLPSGEVPVYEIGYADANIAAGDLNGDGKPDLVIVTRGQAKLQQLPLVQVFLNTSP
jgi:hypothetical protein